MRCDLLGIPVLHGWLVDPQDAQTAAFLAPGEKVDRCLTDV